ncbi:type II toxin-antitoxin system prevent-host-death family antitoxin [bacterium]|nr:MAG: prevent-host-death protein [Caulobacterales bacterium RIFCSPHIGHO2_01_FULL_67_30]TAJ84951.1 MAG: type II toxin-antitoxin system prevent-host-death family antitoxin [bacterium]
MKSVDIEEAKIHLLRLVEEAAKGESFIITEAGKPLVRLEGLNAKPVDTSRRLGFMKGEILVPDDFDTMGQAEIEAMFYGDAVDEDGVSR